MKLKYLIILFLFVNANSFAQTNFGKIKCDSFHVTVDSSVALVYRSKKTAVFNKALNTFLIKPTKGVIFYFDAVDLFIKGDKKGLKGYSFNKEGNAIFKFLSEEEIVLMYEEPKYSNHLISVNGSVLNYQTGDIKKDQKAFYPSIKIQITKYENGLFLVNNVRQPLIEEGEMDIDFFSDSGYTKSGVYNYKTKKWIIPPNYVYIQKWNDNFICLKQNNLTYKMSEDGYHGSVYSEDGYDQYILENMETIRIAKNCRNANEFNFTHLLNLDSVSEIGFEEQTMLIAYKNGKQGLIEVKLNGLFRDTDQFIPDNLDITYTEHLPVKFDQLLVDLDKKKVLSFDQKGKNKIRSYCLFFNAENKVELRDEFMANNEIIYTDNIEFYEVIVDGAKLNLGFNDKNEWKALVANEIKENDFINKVKSVKDNEFGFEILNDSLLYVINYMADENGDFYAPLRSYIYPDEDSIVFSDNGELNLIYPPIKLGYEKSGLYNYNSQNWFINPIYRTCVTNKNGVVLESVIRNSDTGLTEEEGERYSFMSNKGQLSFTNLPIESLENDSTYLNYFLTEISEIIPFAQRHVYWKSPSYFAGLFYALDKQNKWSIVQPIIQHSVLNSKPKRSSAKDFIHYNSACNFVFYLEKDSIFIQFQDIKTGVSQQNGEIYFRIQEAEGFEYEIQAIENRDTSSIKSAEFKNGIKCQEYASITIKNNQLIVNDIGIYNDLPGYYHYLEYDLDLYDYKDYVYKYGTEISAIWKQENGVWRKQTPYYNGIESTPFGYLVNTAEYYELNTVYLEEITRPKEYIMLDKNLKPIVYMDYFNFENAVVYDFGVKLCAESGCFFVNNNGDAITSWEWDDFEVEGDRIKAIKYNPEYFETGAGDPIKEFKYYDLTP